VIDDLTWISPSSARKAPAGIPPSPGRRDPSPVYMAIPERRASPGRVALALGVVLALGAGGAIWWSLRSGNTATEDPAAPRTAAPATIPAPAASGEAEQPGTDAPAATEEFQVVADPHPALPPAPPAATPAPQPATAALPPMQPGDLIEPRQPGVVPPVPLDIPAYEIPPAAKAAGSHATIRVAILVGEHGEVLEVRLAEGDRSGLGFNETALETAKKVVFQPATRDDIPGRMWTELNFEF